MKHIIFSLISGILYTIFLFISDSLMRGRSLSFNENYILPFFLWSVGISIFSFFLIKALNYHRAIKNIGYKRLLIVLTLLFSPIAVLIGYDLYGLVHSVDHLIVISFSICGTYLVIIGIHFAYFWIRNGFAENTPNK